MSLQAREQESVSEERFTSTLLLTDQTVSGIFTYDVAYQLWKWFSSSMFTFLKFATEARDGEKTVIDTIQNTRDMVWYAVLVIVKPPLSEQCYDLEQLKPES